MTIKTAYFDALTAENAALKAKVAELADKYDEEKRIVSRIWEMFGNPDFKSLKGKSIYDLIEDLQKDKARLEYALNIITTIQNAHEMRDK